MSQKLFLYILAMAVVTYLIRSVPFVLFRKKIKSRFIKSLLSYIPYSVLAAMTVPGVFFSTADWISALVGFIVALLFSFKKCPMIVVALASCIAAYLTTIIRLAVI